MKCEVGLDIFDDDIFRAPEGNAESTPKPKKRGRRAESTPTDDAAKAAKAPKKDCSSNKDREAECPLCEQLSILKCKKKYCLDCNPDVESIRKDTKKSLGP